MSIQFLFFAFHILINSNPAIVDPPPAGEVYLFSYFTGNGEDGLHLAWSEDGLRWQKLNNGKSFLHPQVGESKLMRDPCITRSDDGTFHMVWTTSWGGKTIGYSHSSDLVNWSDQLAIPVMKDESNAVNCWAPEINYIKDSEKFIIYWSTSITNKFLETSDSHSKGPERNHRIYYTTTTDFRDFTPAAILYEPGFSVIDASIYPEEGRYLMFLKNETELPKPEKNIRIAWADHIEGPYGKPSAPITGDYWAEGPTAIQIDGKWHLYFDKYRQGHFGVLVSEDLEDWQDLTEKLQMPEGIRHGTVFAVEREVLDKLLQKDE